MTSEASPFWQNAFLVGVLVVMGWCVWSGWRAGLVRSGLALGGMLAGGAAGLAVGGALGPLVGRFFPLPGVLVGVAAGLAVGVGIYVVCWFLGALLFKRTAQQSSAPLRLIYGAGGGVLGAFLGLTVVWGVLMFVRALGGFYEGAYGSTGSSYSSRLEPNAAEAALVKLKRSVEAGSTGRQLEAIDVMPPEFYRVFDKLGRLTARPAAVRRLLEYPPIRDVMNDPRFTAITADSSAAESVRRQDFGALMGNAALLRALDDPALIAKLQKVDIEKALDYALQAPPHSD